MGDTTYNGWTNYETWAVGMFLDGNYDGEGTYRHVLGLVEEACEEFDSSTPMEDAVYDVEKVLEEFVRESMPEMGASVFGDLLGAAIDSVNFYELAESKVREILENER